MRASMHDEVADTRSSEKRQCLHARCVGTTVLGGLLWQACEKHKFCCSDCGCHTTTPQANPAFPLPQVG